MKIEELVSFLITQGFKLSKECIKDKVVYQIKDSQCVIDIPSESCQFSTFRNYTWTFGSSCLLTDLRLDGSNLIQIPVIYKGVA